MQKFTYRFTGDSPEHFGFLPADPPSQWLELGDTVVCNEPVEHARLELVDDKTASRSRRAAAPADIPDGAADTLKEV